MNTEARLSFDSVHRVKTAVRCGIVVLVPLLIALMSWAIYEILTGQLSGQAATPWWQVTIGLALCGGFVLVFLAALIWAFRAEVRIAGDQLIVRGAFLTTVITPGRLQNFRWVNGQLLVYLDDRAFAVTIGGFDNLWLVHRWLGQRTADLAEELATAEETAMRQDLTLGSSESARNERLEKLHQIVRWGNGAIVLAAAIGLINFLFFERPKVELAAVAALVLMPFMFDLLALANPGHIHIDQDEGSRYPQILTGTLIAGAVLVLMSVLDRGALLEATRFYQIVGIAAVVKAIVWYSIDPDRFRQLRQRGAIAFAVFAAAMLVLPAFWVGGTVYQLNKLLDDSPVTGYSTEILDKDVSSGRTTSYTVTVSGWDEAIDDRVDITVRRNAFESLEIGQRVTVGVREGALGVAWVAELQAVETGTSAQRTGPLSDAAR